MQKVHLSWIYGEDHLLHEEDQDCSREIRVKPCSQEKGQGRCKKQWGPLFKETFPVCLSPLLFHLQLSSLRKKSVQFSSVQSCLTLCDPMNCSMPGLPVHHQLQEPTQTHAHWVGDAIQPSHPLSSPFCQRYTKHHWFYSWICFVLHWKSGFNNIKITAYLLYPNILVMCELRDWDWYIHTTMYEVGS